MTRGERKRELSQKALGEQTGEVFHRVQAIVDCYSVKPILSRRTIMFEILGGEVKVSVRPRRISIERREAGEQEAILVLEKKGKFYVGRGKGTKRALLDMAMREKTVGKKDLRLIRETVQELDTPIVTWRASFLSADSPLWARRKTRMKPTHFAKRPGYSWGGVR